MLELFNNVKNSSENNIFVLLTILSLFITSKSFADSNFNTSFDVTYNVSPSGLTHTTFKGSLINQTDGYYASSYSVKVGFADLENLKASDGNGPINATLDKSPNETQINLPFNQKVVGKDQVLNFTFSFDTNSAANHVGQIWEVNLPGFENQADFQNINIHLIVPSTFGAISYVKPNISLTNGLNFTKSDLGSSGVSIAFGNIQSFDFKLNYQLNNPNLFPIQTEIALPPNTSYQNVEIESINPKPLNVYEDIDGNWLAKYYLLPQENKLITVNGNALISLNSKKQSLSADDRKIYLEPQQYWEVNDSKIQSLAKSLKTPQAIFNYVVTHLSYNYNRANSNNTERFGAAAILQTPDQAVCLEFTDLFIALARAAGIPSREITGYAYTANSTQRPLSFIKDILHAWPEYYDDSRGEWIQIDPTWENTTGGTDYFNTFDFDHLAFAINGNSSTYPIPAGGYKTADSNSKDVFVSFSDTLTHPQPKIAAQVNISLANPLAKSSSANLIINNTSGVELPIENINLMSKNITFNPNNFLSDPIPPYGTISYDLSTNNYLSLTPKTTLVTIQIGNTTTKQQIQILPFFLENKLYLIGGVILIGILIFIILKITI